MLGDVNLVDFDNVALHPPELVHDLPGGARRFIQRSEGWVATVKRGEVVLRDGEDQGARPGGLLRGGAARP
jgi:N-acyl-D-aspartate/D-glutamate deacylase